MSRSDSSSSAEFRSFEVSDSMLKKLLQSQRDGEFFWSKIEARIQNLKNLQSQTVSTENMANLKGAKFMSPIAKTQIGLLAATILISMVIGTFFLTIGPPQKSASFERKKPTGVNDVLAQLDVTPSPVEEPVQVETAPESQANLSELEILTKPSRMESCKTATKGLVQSAIRRFKSGEVFKTKSNKIIASKARLDQMLAKEPSPPTRSFLIDISFNKSGYGCMSINDVAVCKKVGPWQISSALDEIRPELINRINLIGPWIGNIDGEFVLETKTHSDNVRFKNATDLDWAVSRLRKKLKSVPSAYRPKKNSKTSPVEVCRKSSVNRINELFQQWGRESLANGGPKVQIQRQASEKFSNMLSKEEFREFVETGRFETPELDQIYLPETTLQTKNSDELKLELAQSKEVSLFSNKRDFKKFESRLRKFNSDRVKNGFRTNQLESTKRLKATLEEREDLAGLPIVLGDKCQLDENDADKMDKASRSLGPVFSKLDLLKTQKGKGSRKIEQLKNSYLASIDSTFKGFGGHNRHLSTVDQMLQARDPEFRVKFVKFLGIQQSETSANLLTCYAKYDLDAGIRMAATKELSKLSPDSIRNQLLKGFEYPWLPAVQHSAEALVRLNDTAVIPYLVSKLRHPNPKRIRRLESGAYVRSELVAINHLKNCMLCHADSNSTKDKGRAPVPQWDRPLPIMYYHSQADSLAARADVTYLRQDFSVVQPVSERPRLWPKMQRMDYLVQQVPLTAEETRRNVTQDESEYRNAIIFALRMLTELNPPDDSFETWKSSTKAW